MLLHLLMEPHDSRRPIRFHHPVISQHGAYSASLREQAILQRADAYLRALRTAQVRTVHDAIEHILAWHLPFSWHDQDLVACGRIGPHANEVVA